MADRERQGVLPYPPPATLWCVTRWDLSWLEMTHLVRKAAVCVMTNFTGGLFGVYLFFENVRNELTSCGLSCWRLSHVHQPVSLFHTPFFLTLPSFPLFFWFTDNTQPPFLGYCLCFPLCASVGNSAFPVSHLVGWSSVDFVQTVGSALRGRLSTWFAVAPHSTQFIQEACWQ